MVKIQTNLLLRKFFLIKPKLIVSCPFQLNLCLLPDLGILEEDTVRRKHRDDQSRHAVAEALLEDEGAQEGGDGQEHQLETTHALALPVEILGGERSVRVKHVM